jgi:hypothetical protein
MEMEGMVIKQPTISFQLNSRTIHEITFRCNQYFSVIIEIRLMINLSREHEFVYRLAWLSKSGSY